MLKTRTFKDAMEIAQEFTKRLTVKGLTGLDIKKSEVFHDSFSHQMDTRHTPFQSSRIEE